MERNQAEQVREKNMQNENRCRELRNSIKYNICIIGIPEGEDRENLFKEIKADDFPNLGKETEIQIQEAQRSLNKINPRRSTPRHIVIKMAKSSDKEKNFKAARVKIIMYKGNTIRLLADFSAENLQARRKWHDIFKVLKEKNLQPSILYPARPSFRIEREGVSHTNKS